MNRKPEMWEYYAFFGSVLLGIGWILYDFYNMPLYVPCSGAVSCLGCYLHTKLVKVNDNRLVAKIYKRSLIPLIFLFFGVRILADQTAPRRKFSREPPPVYMALVESSKQLLEQKNLLDMTADSYLSLVDAAKRSGSKHPYADTPEKPGDNCIWNVAPDSIHFPDELLRYSPFEIGIMRNQVKINFITNKPYTIFVDIQHFPTNDNKWVVTQHGVGVLWEGNVGSKEEAEERR